jgi:predicted FMN-binding regulatory protein PaiB
VRLNPSPSWYAPGATRAPTWNFSVAHCYGVPEILSPEENLRVLAALRADGPHPGLADEMEQLLAGDREP